jgi:fructose-specific phosphotransferase system IIC component
VGLVVCVVVCGGVCGGVVVWWCGGVVVWWCGGVVVWWCCVWCCVWWWYMVVVVCVVLCAWCGTPTTLTQRLGDFSTHLTFFLKKLHGSQVGVYLEFNRPPSNSVDILRTGIFYVHH